jgi:hypothetical protein
MRRRLLLALLLCVGLALPAAAQTYRETPGPVSLGAAGAFTQLGRTKGLGTATVSIDGTFVGTLTFEIISADGLHAGRQLHTAQFDNGCIDRDGGRTVGRLRGGRVPGVPRADVGLHERHGDRHAQCCGGRRWWWIGG